MRGRSDKDSWVSYDYVWDLVWLKGLLTVDVLYDCVENMWLDCWIDMHCDNAFEHGRYVLCMVCDMFCENVRHYIECIWFMIYVLVCEACGENNYACELLCVGILLCNLDLVVISHPSAVWMMLYEAFTD